MKNYINKNLYDFLEYLGQNVSLYQSDSNLTLTTEVSHPFYNALYLENLNKLDIPKKSIRVIVTDKVSFNDAKDRLEELGCFYAEDTVGMVMDLDNLNIIDNDDNIFNEVTNEEELLDWLEVLQVSYKIPDTLREFSFKYFNEVDSKLKHYTLTVDDKVVAACSLFFDGEFVGLYNVCTLPEYRNKGLGSYITKKALYEAKSVGYKQAILQSSVMGSSIYKKIGFKEYNKQSIFIYLEKNN